MGVDREQLARRAVESYLQQLLNHGFFHADPHPGEHWGWFVYLTIHCSYWVHEALAAARPCSFHADLPPVSVGSSCWCCWVEHAR